MVPARDDTWPTGAETALRERLQLQPHLILVLSEGGRVAEAYGPAPAYVSIEALMGQGLLSLVEPARWRDLTVAPEPRRQRRPGPDRVSPRRRP